MRTCSSKLRIKNRYYGFKLCPGFWKALISQHESGHIFSIDRVYDELIGEGDELSGWAKDSAPKTFFKKTQDQAVIAMYQKMVTWVNAQPQFTSAAKAEFASLTVADGWVMAYAKVNELVVVTHEEYAAQAQRKVPRKVPMPNIGIEFDVKCFNTFEMLDDLNVKFILSTKTPR